MSVITEEKIDIAAAVAAGFDTTSKIGREYGWQHVSHIRPAIEAGLVRYDGTAHLVVAV